MIDPCFDCPQCEMPRLSNPCEHCGDLYVPRERFVIGWVNEVRNGTTFHIPEVMGELDARYVRGRSHATYGTAEEAQAVIDDRRERERVAASYGYGQGRYQGD